MTNFHRRRATGFLQGVVFCALSAALVFCPVRGTAAADVVVAAASSLRFVMPALADAFRAETGHKVVSSLGSSGNLARQIRRGAPFHVFVAADTAHADIIVRAGLASGPAKAYARGRLVLYRRGDQPASLAAFKADVSGGDARLAIANPEHAPYGKAAMKVLDHLALTAALKNVLVIGENAAQAGQFAHAGGVSWALLPRALMRAPGLGRRGRWVDVSTDLHDPLVQSMVVVRGAGAEASAFFDFMTGAKARGILTAYGFELPVRAR